MLLDDPLTIRLRRDFALGCGVAEGDAILGFEPVRSPRSAEVVAFHVPDRHLQHLAFGKLVHEWTIGGFSAQMKLLAGIA